MAERAIEQQRRALEASLVLDHETEEEDDEEEDELRRAARAGILLLEKNQELQHENVALRAQVQALESERPRLGDELRKQGSELVIFREERRTSLAEITRLQGELRSTSLLVTTSLDREQRLKQQKETADAALAVAENKFLRLQLEFEELARRTVPEAAPHVPKEEITVANPAATYDSNQSSSFSLVDYQEMLSKWQRASAENEVLHVEMRSLRKDLDAAKRRAIKLSELAPLAERLEKKTLKLQHANDALTEELTEERALSESQRTMIAVYKKIADARPFSTECTCALHPEGDERDGLGVSIQEQLLETNRRLERELRELRRRLERNDPADGSTDNSSSQSQNNNNDGDEEQDAELLASEVEAEATATLLSLEAVASHSHPHSDVDHLIRKIQALEEKQSALRDSLRHAKHQWQAAIASQKALEECNCAAQGEIARLTQQVEHKVAALSATPRGGEPSGGGGGGGHAVDTNGDEDMTRPPRRSRSVLDGSFEDESESDKWVEEMAPYPAPPGDLNSPLIKCLLDHWTTDKSKIMHLTDWLHHAIRGTGKPRPLRLEHLTSEVAAGFTQLLAPILRERHGVAVTIYRRESVQILTDMVFQAHQPTETPETPSIFSTLAAKLGGVLGSTVPSPSGTFLDEQERQCVERSNGSGSGASSESGSSVSGARSRRRRPENSVLMSEAHFLYG